MLKVFSHYFPSHTVLKILMDVVLLCFAVSVAIALQFRGAKVEWALVVPSAMLFAVAMIALNSVLGLYRPCGGSPRDAFVRVVLGLAVSVPVAYGVFLVLPWDYFASEAIQLTVLTEFGKLRL